MRPALVAGRWAGRTSRALGRGEGVAVEGAVALRLDPHILARLAAGRRVILVSGTNGKTTTTAMIVAALGGGVASNVSGANIRACLVPALARSDASTVVLEVDELHLPQVIRDVRPAMVVALNLSRDQLDRMHEVSRIGEAWGPSWSDTASKSDIATTVLANASDPQIVSAVATDGNHNPVWVDAGLAWRADASVCGRCHGLVSWQEVPAREGSSPELIWSCTCRHMPRPAYVRSGSVLSLPDGRIVRIQTSLPGAVNLANAAMAIAAAIECGIDPEVAARRVAAVESIEGRYGVIDLGGRPARLLLAKNPAGWQSAIGMLDPSAPLIVGLNARVVDGRDTSWLYDVDFSGLAGRRVGVIGERRADLALRLHYAGAIPLVNASPVLLAQALPDGPLTVAANYTCFMQMRRYGESRRGEGRRRDR